MSTRERAREGGGRVSTGLVRLNSGRRANQKEESSQRRRYLSFASWARFLKFNAVGLIGTAVNEGLLILLTSWGMYYLYADSIAIELSILSNFVLNDAWTFRDRRHGHVWVRLLKFNLLMLVGLVVNLLVLYGATEYLRIYYAVSNVIGIAVAFAVRYLLSDRYAWRMVDKIKKEEG